MWDLDAATSAGDATRADSAGAAADLAGQLARDGIALVDDYGLDIAALNRSIDEAFQKADPSVTSVASNGERIGPEIERDRARDRARSTAPRLQRHQPERPQQQARRWRHVSTSTRWLP